MTALEVKNLSYSYNPKTSMREDAVIDVSFKAEKGEIIGIIGHTGSGKSTLVQHFNGLLKSESGEILFNGENIWKNEKEIKKYRFKIGLVFQYPEYQLFDETVYDDIAFGPKNMGIKGDELVKTVTETALSVGLNGDYLSRSPFDLSGGEKRRVAIAGVLAMKPEVIVFDEPTAGLDPIGRDTIMKIIRDYRDKHNATVFIVSHSMEDMANIADKLLVMNMGRAVMFDTTENVFSNYDKLKEYGLSVPSVTRIVYKLKNKGMDLGNGIITVDKAVIAINKYRNGGDKV